MMVFLMILLWLAAGYAGAALIYTVNVYDGSTTDSGPSLGILVFHILAGAGVLIFGALFLFLAFVFDSGIRKRCFENGILLPFSAKAEAVSGECDI